MMIWWILKDSQEVIKTQLEELRDEMDKQFSEMSRFYGELSAELRAILKLQSMKNQGLGDK
ncbi:MAG: hypothetical protein HC924_17480 [Synechococcaceae cyanobacterium SM2_3_2]|nr:hypothetical protein [Synechococcaceae cyanobacterium SM2_3_2]